MLLNSSKKANISLALKAIKNCLNNLRSFPKSYLYGIKLRKALESILAELKDCIRLLKGKLFFQICCSSFRSTYCESFKKAYTGCSTRSMTDFVR